MLKDKRIDRNILRELVDRNFSFGDLDERFIGIDSSTGNIPCIFHQDFSHFNTPAGKIYYNDEKDIYTLHCFTERRNFTAFDYVERLLCKEQEKYRNVWDFLETNLSKEDLLNQYESLKKNMLFLGESDIKKKVEYIDSVYNKYYNVRDYIEELYTS